MNQAQEIRKIWSIKAIGDTSVVELRAIKPGEIKTQLFKRSNYPSIDELISDFETEALRLNAASYNIYYVMNPYCQNTQIYICKGAFSESTYHYDSNN